MHYCCPLSFVQLNVPTELEILAQYFVPVHCDTWFRPAKENNIGAGCLVMLAGFIMNVGHTGMIALCSREVAKQKDQLFS
jgi:hypothetical protein